MSGPLLAILCQAAPACYSRADYLALWLKARPRILDVSGDLEFAASACRMHATGAWILMSLWRT